jgi:hypothetical protein
MENITSKVEQRKKKRKTYFLGFFIEKQLPTVSNE